MVLVTIWYFLLDSQILSVGTSERNMLIALRLHVCDAKRDIFATFSWVNHPSMLNICIIKIALYIVRKCFFRLFPWSNSYGHKLQKLSKPCRDQSELVIKCLFLLSSFYSGNRFMLLSRAYPKHKIRFIPN